MTRLRRAAALLVATGLLTAGCDDAHIGSYGPVPAASTTPPSPGAADPGAIAATHIEATRLIGLVDPPPGSTVLTGAPAGLTGPVDPPAMGDLVDVDRIWTVPLSFADAQKWALAARPGGYRSDNSTFGRISTPGTQLRLWRVYEAPTGKTPFDFDQLQLSISADGAGSTYLRADAVVAPLGAPYLLPGPNKAQHMQVTIAGGCPATAAGVAGVENPGQSDLDNMLIPAGTPTAAVVCHYGGAESRHQLVGSVRYGAADAERLAAQAAAVSALHEATVLHTCPISSGKVTVFAFAYPGRPDVDLWNADDGCPYVSNGHMSVNGHDIVDSPPATVAP